MLFMLVSLMLIQYVGPLSWLRGASVGIGRAAVVVSVVVVVAFAKSRTKSLTAKEK